jgi:hypothetical protein
MRNTASGESSATTKETSNMSDTDKLADALQFAHDEFEDKRHVAQCRGDTALAGYYERCRDRVAPALAEHAASLAALPAQGEWVLPPGWRIQRNTDGSIGVFAPEPRPGESRRTSHALYPGVRGDLHELMFKLFDTMLAAAPQPAPAPVQVDETVSRP